MAERRSLLDDDRGESPKKPAKSGGGGLSGDKGKLALAIGLFVVAGVVYLFMNGAFSSPEKPPPLAEADIKALEEQKAAHEAALKSPNPPVVGGD